MLQAAPFDLGYDGIALPWALFKAGESHPIHAIGANPFWFAPEGKLNLYEPGMLEMEVTPNGDHEPLIGNHC